MQKLKQGIDREVVEMYRIMKVVDYTIDATDYTDESVGSSDV